MCYRLCVFILFSQLNWNRNIEEGSSIHSPQSWNCHWFVNCLFIPWILFFICWVCEPGVKFYVLISERERERVRVASLVYAICMGKFHSHRPVAVESKSTISLVRRVLSFIVHEQYDWDIKPLVYFLWFRGQFCWKTPR